MEQNKQSKELIWHTRIQTGALLLILVIVLSLGIVLLNGYGTVMHTVRTLDEQIEKLDLAELNLAIESLHNTADNLATIDIDGLNQTALALQGAANSLAQIDSKEVNEAVAALTDAANNLADMDVESINQLVTSLESVAAKLQGAVNGFTGIFKK